MSLRLTPPAGQRPGRGALALVAVLGLVCLAVSAGCAVQLPGSGEPAQLYVLTPKSTFPDDLVAVDWQLLIETPIAQAGLDTPRIAVAYSPIELNYFARSNWTDRAPQMVQRLLIESFENSGRIVAVGRDAIGLRSDYVLKTELREFQAEYRAVQGDSTDAESGLPVGEAPNIRVRINAKLVRMPQRVIVASENFENVVAARENSMRGIVTAFDEALGRTIKFVVVWTLTEGERLKGGS
ncbi:MAG: membrane integrity-associated transporter subunit PqiC [Rhodospirillales bacterium]|nr:MAG: membrane integrity-associated transporter subunit PqiC [Rhodospirillales bacterium]